MHLFALFIFLIFQNNDKLQGRWKLQEVPSFLTVLTSQTYDQASDEQKLLMAETFEFVLENTFYSFKSDSVYFTDAGPNKIVKQKNGRFLTKQDTLYIFESKKVNPIKYFISSLNEKELKMRFVDKDGGLGPVEMIFVKLD